MKTVVFTSDSHAWLLGGFFHQWHKHRVDGEERLVHPEVAGFNKPSNLPARVPFVSMGKQEDYPVERWSDAIIGYLQSIEDELVMIFLEDYWLMRPMRMQEVQDAHDLMLAQPDLLRFDLTTDRAFHKLAEFAGHYKSLDVCSVKSDYSVSFQAGIYRRKLLLEVLRPGESPWESELNASMRANWGPLGVYGSYQWPVCYMIVVNKGEFDRDGRWMRPARSLSAADWAELDELGFTREPAEVTQ